MIDRINGCWVAFEHDVRTDDAESTINAIKHIKGVIAVEQNIVDPRMWIAETRVRQELRDKLFAVLYSPEKKP